MINVTIFGCGNVGVTIAKELLDSGIEMHLNIIDIKDDVQALVNDLNAANSVLKTCDVSFNDKNKFREADYIFVCFASEATTIGNRLDKAENHIDLIYKEFEIVAFQNDPYFIVITNPVDVISYHVKKVLNNNTDKIIGTGTYLETLRYHYMLSQQFKVKPKDAEGFLLGEHGNSAVTILSKTKINGADISAEEYPIAVKAGEDAIEAPYIIRKMGHFTKFAISKCAVNIFKAFYFKKDLHLPAGVFLNKENQKLLNCGEICFSTEVSIIDGKIIQHSLADLGNDEIELLKKSAHILMDFTENYIRSESC